MSAGTHLLVAVGLGSNQPPAAVEPFVRPEQPDPRARALEGALVGLVERGHALVATSRLHETEPHGVGPGHGPYLNAAALVRAGGSIPALLEDCLALERAAGRGSKGDLAPRPLDLDILAAWTVSSEGGAETPVTWSDDRLVVPHPRMLERSFVLVPLAEVAGGLLVPTNLGARRVADLLADVSSEGLKPGPPSALFGRLGA